MEKEREGGREGECFVNIQVGGVWVEVELKSDSPTALIGPLLSPLLDPPNNMPMHPKHWSVLHILSCITCDGE